VVAVARICLGRADAQRQAAGGRIRPRAADFPRLMALFGPRAMSDLSPFSGVKRKLDFRAVRSVDDPQETLDTSPAPPVNLDF
jgi:hypothetical protein